MQYPLFFYFTRIEKVFEKVEKDESEMMTIIQENVSASKVVRAFANEPFEIEKMDVKNTQYTKAIYVPIRLLQYTGVAWILFLWHSMH